MTFFWKYTRSGRISSSYKSFILDIHESNTVLENGKRYWLTSFEELEMFLILLQDIEVVNNGSSGPLKLKYAAIADNLGYRTTNDYLPSRRKNGLVVGQDVNGIHQGSPLDWGIFINQETSIKLDITSFQFTDYIDSHTGKRNNRGEDKLSSYRGHTRFLDRGSYIDLMPEHIVAYFIIIAMQQFDQNRTRDFLESELKWIKVL